MNFSWIRDHFPKAIVARPDEGYLRVIHPARPEDPRPADRLRADGLLFDLETLGFVGRPLFLIGMLQRAEDGRGYEVVQLLARDYTEEENVLGAFAREARTRPCWVSFNGKSFDLPSLRQRAAYHGVRLPEPSEHLDLLFPARKLYRGVLPNCRLKTLEGRVFGQHRFDDIDGGEIPPAYHAFVRTGEPSTMARILAHNRDDLVTLARLWAHLEEPDAPVS